MNENQNVEFKQSWRDEYLKWICGFANVQGGTLYIGKDDHGVTVGVNDAAKLLEDLPNKMRDILGIVPDVDLLTEDGKDIIRITVEPFPYPVSYKGQYHIRSGSTKQELKGAALDHFLLRKTGKHWDGVPVPRVSLDDLDSQIIDWFRKRAARSKRLSLKMLEVDDAALLEKLRLTEGDYLKRATILLFHPDPEIVVTGAYIKLGYFRTDSELLYQDEIHGDLFTQVEKTLDLLLTKYLRALISYEGLQRVESYPVPESALREALTNAVVHKDYASSVPIQIRVYDDKILLWNNGRLPDNWTVENLLAAHPSIPFNPDIANTFFRAGMIEAWGRGIEKMRAACEAEGVPGPRLRVEPIGMWVEFENHVVQPESQQESQQESRQESLDVRVLRLLGAGPRARSELARELGQKRASGQLNKVIRQLLDEQAIEFTIPDKPQSRLQKYRLTEKGEAALEDLRE